MKTSTSFVRAQLAGLACVLVLGGAPWLAHAGQAVAAASDSAGYGGASASAPSASQAEEAQQPNDGSDYIAGWTVMGEICEKKYPRMKAAVAEFWSKRWDKATRERVAAMKKTADFKAKLVKYRNSLAERREEVIEQCGRLFFGGAH